MCEQPETGTLLFVLWGFLLLGSEVVLLAFGKRNLSRMIEDYHHIRTGDTEDRWDEYEEHQAILECASAATYPGAQTTPVPSTQHLSTGQISLYPPPQQ